MSVEKFINGPKQEFLDLTEKFISAIIDKFKSMNMIVKVYQLSEHEFRFHVADEVYGFHNDGVVASWKFIGIRQM